MESRRHCRLAGMAMEFWTRTGRSQTCDQNSRPRPFRFASDGVFGRDISDKTVPHSGQHFFCMPRKSYLHSGHSHLALRKFLIRTCHTPVVAFMMIDTLNTDPTNFQQSISVGSTNCFPANVPKELTLFPEPMPFVQNNQRIGKPVDHSNA